MEKIKQLMKKYNVPGLSLAILEEGEIRSLQSYGLENCSLKRYVHDETIFEAASLSKPVFAYGVLKMFQKGLLDLDTPLFDYLAYKDVKNDLRVKKITARMVLNHSNGFPNWRPKGGELKIHFSPGEKFSYSGEGFVYLQKVIEQISGQSLEQYMQAAVFEPLAMTQSTFVWHRQKATGYDAQGNPVLSPEPTPMPDAAYTLHTTSPDYAKFVQAILKNNDLSAHLIDEMLMPSIAVCEEDPCCLDKCPTKPSSTVFWGLGWGTQKISDRFYFWHWGNNKGFKSYIAASKEGGDAIIIFTNSDNGLSVIAEIVTEVTGIQHPAFMWLKV